MNCSEVYYRGQNAGYMSLHFLSISAFPHFYMVCLVQCAIRERKQQRYVTLCSLSMQNYVQFLTQIIAFIVRRRQLFRSVFFL